MTNKHLSYFIPTNYFNFHKLINSNFIKQTYIEDIYYKKINRYGKIV